MKDTKILIAKLVVAILVLLIGIVSILKLISVLSKPQSQFETVISKVEDDFSFSMDYLAASEIYKLLANDTFDMNIDTKVEISRLTNTRYTKYNELINNSSFIGNIEVDRKNNYLKSVLAATKGTNTLNLSYTENKADKYLKIGDDRYTLLSQYEGNLKIFDSAIYKKIIVIFANELKSEIADKNIDSISGAIGVNGKTYDVNTFSYTLSGYDLNYFFDNFIESLLADATISEYLARYYGVSANNLQAKMNEIKSYLRINQASEYSFKAHIKSKTTVPLRLELVENKTERTLLSYSLDENNYRSLKLALKEEKIYSITVQVGTFEMILENDREKVTIGHTFKNAGEGKGHVVILDKETNDTKEIIDYDYLNIANNNVNSLALNIELYPLYVSKEAEVSINSSILISYGKVVSRSQIDHFSNEIDSEKRFEDYASTYLERYYLQEYTSQPQPSSDIPDDNQTENLQDEIQQAE